MPVGAHFLLCLDFCKITFYEGDELLASEYKHFFLIILFINIYYFDPHEAVCQRVSEPVDLTNS